MTAADVDEDEPAPVRQKCESCGGDLKWQDECPQCYGEDPYGYPVFCPSCDFCCGC